MKANEYLVLSQCVESGVNRGWRKAFKHLDVPAQVQDWLDEHENNIKDNIDSAVLGDICEYFKFEQPKEQ